jgi:TolB-like protein
MLKIKKDRRTIFLFIILFFIFLNANAKADVYNDKLNALISSLAAGTKNTTVQTIAVVNFIETTTKQRFMFSDLLEDDLTTKLIQTNKFHVIVKSKIEEVLKELKFGYEGLVDPDKRKQFGKLAMADAILTGTYRTQGSNVIVNAQLINVETGEAIWADSISIPRDELPPGAFQFPNIYQETPTAVPGEKEGVAVPIQTGIISITSQPSDAPIYLDAKPMGNTPAILQGVTVGKRMIAIIKDGYVTYIKVVTVETNKTTSIQAVLSYQTGSLEIDTEPSGADIYIDGYKKGTSPLTITLNIGTHKIKAIEKNYQAYEKAVTIGYKEQKSEDFQLTEEPGSLLVRVSPSPADVYIDEELKGEVNSTTPALSIEKFPSGEHTVVIKKDGYKKYTETFETHAYQNKKIDAVLEKQETKSLTSSSTKKFDITSVIFPSVYSIDFLYDNLTPLNNTFNRQIMNISGTYAGANLSIFYIGWDYWDASASLNIPGVYDISGSAFNIGIVYPLAFNITSSISLIVYEGYGGRFESIEVRGIDPSTSNNFDITYRNNSSMVSGGIKLIFPLLFNSSNTGGSGPGLDISYSQTFGARYTNYQMFRIGVVYGWL